MHIRLKILVCDMCDFKCSVDAILWQHIKLKHSQISVKRCVFCNFVTKSSSDMEKHHIKFHPNKPLLHACNISDIGVPTRRHLTTHK